jgi:hypothetical protein
MKQCVYGLLMTTTLMGISSHSGSALVWPEEIKLEQLKILAENKPITIENETIELKSVELTERLSKNKHFNSEHEKFKSMLPGKGQIASKGKVLGLGKSYAIRQGHCDNTATCQYTFRTFSGTLGNMDPSTFTLEIKDPTTVKFIHEKLHESELAANHKGAERSFKVNQHLITFDELSEMISRNRDHIIASKSTPGKNWQAQLFAEGGLEKLREVYRSRKLDIGLGGIVLKDLSEKDFNFLGAIYVLYGKNKEPLMEIVFKEKDEGKQNVKPKAQPSEAHAREVLGLPATGALTREQISAAFKKKTLEAREKPGDAGADINKLQEARNVLYEKQGS